MKEEIIRLKGKISVSLLLLSIILMASVHSATAATIMMNVDPPLLEVDIGETFTITVNITNVEDPGVYSYQVKLNYSATLLNATEATYPSGHFMEGLYTFLIPIVIDREEGTVLFGASILGEEPGKTGSGVLATIQFNGTGVGDATLEIGDVILLNPDGVEIEYTVNDGVVNVIPEFTSALIIFVFMTITLVAILLKKLTASKNQNAYCP